MGKITIELKINTFGKMKHPNVLFTKWTSYGPQICFSCQKEDTMVTSPLLFNLKTTSTTKED